MFAQLVAWDNNVCYWERALVSDRVAMYNSAIQTTVHVHAPVSLGNILPFVGGLNLFRRTDPATYLPTHIYLIH